MQKRKKEGKKERKERNKEDNNDFSIESHLKWLKISENYVSTRVFLFIERFLLIIDTWIHHKNIIFYDINT